MRVVQVAVVEVMEYLISASQLGDSLVGGSAGAEVGASARIAVLPGGAVGVERAGAGGGIGEADAREHHVADGVLHAGIRGLAQAADRLEIPAYRTGPTAIAVDAVWARTAAGENADVGFILRPGYPDLAEAGEVAKAVAALRAR